MTTFSQLVDDMATELVRPDLRTAIATFTNQSVREVHFRPNVQAPAQFGANRKEIDVSVTSDGVTLWNFPYPSRFQALESAYVPEIGRYIKPKNPRLIYQDTDEPFSDLFSYQTGNGMAFASLKAGWTLSLTWFEYPPRLQYYPVGSRPSEYDIANDSYSGDAAAQALSTHWVLQRWGEECIKEGVRAKVYKRLSDTERARMAYSLFENLKQDLWMAEGV